MNKKLITSLTKKKYRDKLGLFVAEGMRFVCDIPDYVHIEMYAVTEEFLSKHEFSFRQGVKLNVFGEAEFKKLTGTVTPQGILAVCRQISHDTNILLSGLNNDTFIVADGIKDPGNLGTIIRTAGAAGVKAVFLIGDTVDLYNEKVLRSTMGAIFNVSVIKTGNEIFDALKSKGVEIIGTFPKADRLYYETCLTGNIAIIIGHEAEGISDLAESYCNTKVSIPVALCCESLNAAVAAAVIVYESHRQKNGAGK